MRFSETRFKGVVVIDLEPQRDERGFFARAYCAEELAAHGLNPAIAQSSISFNRKKGTLRGMHWQIHPHEEDKMVRCTAGAIFDVVIDVRRASPTYGQWLGFELSAENRTSLYVAGGFAHGFLTLTDNAEVFYQMSVPYAPQMGRGIRWDDPDIGIKWPARPAVISERDRLYPMLRDVEV